MKKFILLFIPVILMSCLKRTEDDTNPYIHYSGEVMTLNEGNYMASNASMTCYNPYTKTATGNFFSKMAGESVVMGDSPTSIYEYGKICYISMSGSGKIYGFSQETDKLLFTIKGLSSPRYMYALNNKMWVSDLYNSNLTQIDLTTKEIIRQVSIESPAEMLIAFGNYIYANLWNGNNRILKIDPESGETIQSLEVGIQPTSMAIDRRAGKLWVYCDGGGWEGNPIGFEDPSIFRIDISTDIMIVEKRFDLTRTNGYCFKLALGTDKYGYPTDDYLYFINDNIYRIKRTDDVLPAEPFIMKNTENFYSIAISENKEIYIADATDYVSDGLCYRYNESGDLLDTFSTGISPGYIFISTD